MLVTEEEAKTKRCQESYGPQLIVPQPPPSSFAGTYQSGFPSLPPSPPSPVNCIGSACMAWRHLEAEVPPLYEEYATAANGVPPGAGWSLVCVNNRDRRWRREIRSAQPARGFCGKAGQLYRFD